MDNLHTTKRSRLDYVNDTFGGGCAFGPPASTVKLGDGNNHRGGNVKSSEDRGNTEGAVRHWHHHASRICRASRVSGGKDRHSKVLTAKGLRDRRVRLSVSTAIQFYDLQDRLGVDQPSKAVEWLIKAASAAINELPALGGPFPEHPDRLTIEETLSRRQEEDIALAVEDGADGKRKGHVGQFRQQQHLSLSKSACSSTSETSKGSALSLTRTERPVKARERAKVSDSTKEDGNHNLHGNNTQSSFTELLTGSGGGAHDHHSISISQTHSSDGASVGTGFLSKNFRHLPLASVTTDYFHRAGLSGQGKKPQQAPGIPAQAQIGNSSSLGMMAIDATAASATTGDHPELQQQISFLQDHLIPVAAIGTSGECNLNFAISSGLAGFNRGTLQSNSQSLMSQNHHLQRFSSPVDGSNLPFFLTAPASAAVSSAENHFPAGYDSHIQQCFGDGYQNANVKGKEKG